jgi:hypothetical protein
VLSARDKHSERVAQSKKEPNGKKLC